MLTNRDIDTVDMYLAGNRDSELLAAWNRIKTELEVGQKPTTNTQSTAIAQILQLVEKAKLKISNGNMCPISACDNLSEAAAKLRAL